MRTPVDLARFVRFLSRLPVPPLAPGDDPSLPPDFERAGWLVPVAGVVIALPAAAVLWLAGQTALPAGVIAGFALATLMLSTGCLHEDGLADVADGFGGGDTRARKLEIMRDSRVGTYGAAAVGLSLILRTLLYAALLAHGTPTSAALALLAVAAFSRALILPLWVALPPARVDGAAALWQPGRRPAALAVVAGVVLLTLALPAGGVVPILKGMIAAAAGVAVLARVAQRQIGGRTGDVLGAAQQLAEILFLAGLLA